MSSSSARRETNENCAVCQDRISERASVDGCAHQFCFQCISSWVLVNSTCPLCKANVKRISRLDVKQTTDVKRKRLRAEDLDDSEDIRHLYAEAGEVGEDADEDDGDEYLSDSFVVHASRGAQYTWEIAAGSADEESDGEFELALITSSRDLRSLRRTTGREARRRRGREDDSSSDGTVFQETFVLSLSSDSEGDDDRAEKSLTSSSDSETASSALENSEDARLAATRRSVPNVRAMTRHMRRPRFIDLTRSNDR